MTEQEALQQLEALGTEQNRKVYRRHGVGDPLYGVSYANLGKLVKTIKKDHQLARGLWASGNHDARVLATMIADPARMDAKDLDSWVRDLQNYAQTDAFSKLAGHTPHARLKMEAWTRSPEEWIGAAGWNVLGLLATADTSLKDEDLEPYLEVIEREIHTRKNRVRYAMNGALIAIGTRNERLEKRALAVAAKIGEVEVDHGETGCKTPDAAEYIRKVKTRRTKAKT
jgi:3-methyladenine DNA glycosylase AlkD